MWPWTPMNLSFYGEGGSLCCGVRYRMAASQRNSPILSCNKLHSLLPRNSFTAFMKSAVLPKRLRHAGQRADVFSPKEEQDDGIIYLAFCVATVGESVEQAVRTIMSKGAGIESLFLDASATLFSMCFLQGLPSLAGEARGRLLVAAARFGPGYGELIIALKKKLFTLVDAAAIEFVSTKAVS